MLADESDSDGRDCSDSPRAVPTIIPEVDGKRGNPQSLVQSEKDKYSLVGLIFPKSGPSVMKRLFGISG